MSSKVKELERMVEMARKAGLSDAQIKEKLLRADVNEKLLLNILGEAKQGDSEEILPNGSDANVEADKEEVVTTPHEHPESKSKEVVNKGTFVEESSKVSDIEVKLDYLMERNSSLEKKLGFALRKLSGLQSDTQDLKNNEVKYASAIDKVLNRLEKVENESSKAAKQSESNSSNVFDNKVDSSTIKDSINRLKGAAKATDKSAKRVKGKGFIKAFKSKPTVSVDDSKRSSKSVVKSNNSQVENPVVKAKPKAIKRKVDPYAKVFLAEAIIILHNWLHQLPPDRLKEFKATKDYMLYKRALVVLGILNKGSKK